VDDFLALGKYSDSELYDLNLVVHQNLQVTTLSDIAEASGRRITAEAYP
jgi:hypothetical protein